MGQGRGNARASLVGGLAIICIFLALTQPAIAAIYNVGGSNGWTFNVQNWPTAKSFRAGDVLAFNYPRSQHNVVAVSRRGYNSCSAPRGSKAYQTGKDRIRLRRGQNYFICSLPGHCKSGMKIAINAA
ncbi:basic blue protein-like [Amaranthus tricolor]|uniref:basic blue protein-like n=1 Tax=Amaranthus tricolor TaxID=29722 RepID=UPI002584AD2D|nr:basic blue protein-like [Amaranthus tricolor]